MDGESRRSGGRLKLAALKAGVITALLLAVVAEGLTAQAAAASGKRELFDFFIYQEAASRMRDGGDALYDPPSSAESYYIYPPAFAALVAPLSFCSRAASHLWWTVFNLALIPLAGAALAQAFKTGGGTRPIDVLFAAAIATSGALMHNFHWGQTNVWVTTLVLLGFWAIESGRPALGGAVCALAAHLKVTPAVLLMVFVVQRRWRAVFGWCAGALLGLLLPLVWTVPAKGLLGGTAAAWHVNVAYVSRVALPRAAAGEALEIGGFRAPNNSFSAVAHRLFGEGTALSFVGYRKGPLLFRLPEWILRWTGLALAAPLFAAALALAARRRSKTEERFASAGLALLATDLALPLSWPHHLTMLALPAAAVAALPRRNRLYLWAFLAACVATIYGPMFDRTGHTLHAYGVPTLGILLAWGIVFAAFAGVPVKRDENRGGR